MLQELGAGEAVHAVGAGSGGKPSAFQEPADSTLGPGRNLHHFPPPPRNVCPASSTEKT